MKRISLSIYSFGYSAGFIQDSRKGSEDFQNITAHSIANIAKEMGLGGVEIPIDKYFPNSDVSALAAYIKWLREQDLNVYFDLEDFNSQYVKNVSNLISQNGGFLRAKVSNFYGGNRFKNLDLYRSDVDRFSTHIEDCLNTLKANNLKILVENHQDIVIDDIETLVKRFGEEIIGVNWDIGNSLPSGETIESFISKVGRLIGNVHLKDYKLFGCDEGYIMSRCALGQGFVDFKYCVDYLRNDIPLTIELGAMNSRRAEINNPLYWTNTKGVSKNQKEEILKFIMCNIVDGAYKSAWELNLSPIEISSIEMNELMESVGYLKSLFTQSV